MSRRTESLLLALALAASAPASAEKADRDKPMHLEADTLTVDQANKVSNYAGRVTLTQGTMTLKADKVTVRQDEGGSQYATAWGNPVAFRQKQEGKDEYVEGYSQRLEYDGRQDKIELVGNARLVRGADELRGNQITYESNTEFYRVTGSPEGGRVRAVIMPKSTTPGATPSKPDAAPAKPR